jgi:hypothetical protein
MILSHRVLNRCQYHYCGSDDGVLYRQNTSYYEELRNWVTLCPSCKRYNDDCWDEQWKEYYAGLF